MVELDAVVEGKAEGAGATQHVLFWRCFVQVVCVGGDERIFCLPRLVVCIISVDRWIKHTHMAWQAGISIDRACGRICQVVIQSRGVYRHISVYTSTHQDVLLVVVRNVGRHLVLFHHVCTPVSIAMGQHIIGSCCAITLLSRHTQSHARRTYTYTHIHTHTHKKHTPSPPQETAQSSFPVRSKRATKTSDAGPCGFSSCCPPILSFMVR